MIAGTDVTTGCDAHAPVTARCYTLPRRFLHPEIALFSSIVALAAGAWIPAVYSLFKIGAVLSTALRAAVFPCITAALLLVLVLFVKYELRKVRFLLTDEFLVRASSLRQWKIRLLAIESVNLIRLPFSGGILAVRSGRRTMYLPLILRHIGDLVTRIEEACTETAIAASVDEAVWREAHRRSALTGIAVKRAARAYKPLLSISAATIPLAAATGMFFWDIDLVPLMVWSAVAPVVPLAAFTTADFMLRFRQKQEHTKSSSGMTTLRQIDEAKTIFWTGIIYFQLYLIAGIVFRTFAQ